MGKAETGQMLRPLFSSALGFRESIAPSERFKVILAGRLPDGEYLLTAKGYRCR